MEENDKKFVWTKPIIAIGSMITTLILCASLLWGVSQWNNRVGNVETKTTELKSDIVRLDAADKLLSGSQMQSNDKLNEIILNLKTIMTKNGLKYQTIGGN